MLRAWDNCGRFREFLHGLRRSVEWKAYAQEHAESLRAVAELAGFPSDAPASDLLSRVYLVQDAWVCEEAHGLPLSPKPSAELREAVRSLADWGLQAMFADVPLPSMDAAFGGDVRREVGRLTAGLLVTEVLASLERVDAGMLYAPRLSLFSAHDTTVAALLSALRCFDGHGPPYNSTVVFELHKLTGDESVVRAWYNGEPLALPGASADTFPSLSQFRSALEHLGLVVSEDEIFQACGLSDKDHKAPSSPDGDDDGFASGPAPGMAIALATLGGAIIGVACASVAFMIANKRGTLPFMPLGGDVSMSTTIEEDF